MATQFSQLRSNLKSHLRSEHDEVSHCRFDRSNFDALVEDTVLHEVVGFHQCIDEVSLAVGANASPDHYTTDVVCCRRLNSRPQVPFPSATPNSDMTVGLSKVETWFVGKKITCDHCILVYLPWRLQNCSLNALCCGKMCNILAGFLELKPPNLIRFSLSGSRSDDYLGL